MKGYTIQRSIDLLEKGGGRAAGAASDVSYDSTASGISATNVQAAIDELAQGLTDALTGAS